VANFVSDMHGRRAKTDLGPVILAESGLELAIGDIDAVELFQKIDMEVGATELTIGDALETDFLLLFHHLADAFILNGPQLPGIAVAIGETLAHCRKTCRS
jgi:hypothetical protein